DTWMSPVACRGRVTWHTRYPARRKPGAHMGENARWGVYPVPGTSSTVRAVAPPWQWTTPSRRPSGTEYGGTTAESPAAAHPAIATHETRHATNRTSVHGATPPEGVRNSSWCDMRGARDG